MLGFKEQKKVRYGVVGLGNVSQEPLIPGVEHTGNSEITAIVTSHPLKAFELELKYNTCKTYPYEQFQEMIDSRLVDAIYLATPNWRHAEFAVPALEAGIHVLLEKPMEINSARCEAILNAQKRSNAKLMIAYRLHSEPATLHALERVRSGELGHVHLFSSVFSQRVTQDDHRVVHGDALGPLFEMSFYPINGVRRLFGDEPIEAFGAATRHSDSGLGDLDDTVSVILRFPGERLAQFTVSYYGNPHNAYTILGTKAVLEVNPGYIWSKPMEHFWTEGTKEKDESFKNVDHFGIEMKYFSECILEERDPEPDGYEGLADVRVVEAILRSQKSCTFEKIDAVVHPHRVDPSQAHKLSPVKTRKW